MTHCTPLGYPSRYPWEHVTTYIKLKCVRYHTHTQKFKKNIKEIWSNKHEGNTFCPWGTPNDPPWGIKILLKPPICKMYPSLSSTKNKKEIGNISLKETHFTPWGTPTDPPWGAWKTFLKPHISQM